MSDAILRHFEPILKRAEEKAREENKIETVLNAFEEGLPIDSIARISKKSVDEVKAILQKENLLV